MVDKTIMDLPELDEAPATGDYFELVDISDDTDSAEGSSKRISAANLLSSVVLPADAAGYLENDGSGVLSWSTPAGGGGGGSGVVAPKVLIEEITLTTAGEFDFDNIPQGYRRLRVLGNVTSDVSAAVDNLNVYFNTDTTDSNYHAQLLYSTNGISGDDEYTAPKVAIISGTTATITSTDVDMRLEGYTNSIGKQMSSEYSYLREAARVTTGRGTIANSSVTDAITRLRIRTDNHPTDGLTGTLTLYGEY